MKPVTLFAQFSAEMDCRKAIVMWNYNDHEHLVGTDSSCITTQMRSRGEDRWFNGGRPWNLTRHLFSSLVLGDKVFDSGSGRYKK